MTLLVLFGIFAVTLYTGVPVAWAIAISTLAVIFLGLVPLPPSWFAQQVYGGADSISLAAIPLFLVAGGIMNEGGLTRRIIDLADDLFGWVRGGLGVVNVATCMVYGGITGSATADTGAVGSIMIPAMVERGYPPAFAAAVTAAAGTLGIIIPPSVVMIMYGVLTDTSIGGLFAAGIIPGLMLAITFMLTAWWIGVKEGFPKSESRPTLKGFAIHLYRALPALLMPIVVLGSMLTGYATTTEAAFVAVVWALLVGGLLYREITWAALWKIGIEALRMTGAIMIIMAVSTPFSWVLTVEQVPQWTVGLLSASGAGPDRYNPADPAALDVCGHLGGSGSFLDHPCPDRPSDRHRRRPRTLPTRPYLYCLRSASACSRPRSARTSSSSATSPRLGSTRSPGG